ncbi:MAG: phosphotransferase, partial [Dehalococcoidia bacterium]|nr:phosphotransferase [Dehalococcoidia bacterium]
MKSPSMPEGRSAITVDWMERALRSGGATDIPTIEEIAVEDIGAGIGLLGEMLRCRLTYRGDGSKAPQSVIVKLPSQEPKTLRTCKRLKLYKREYDYYRHVGPYVPTRTPVMFYGDFEEKSIRFVLVLEDLGGMRRVDEIEGASAEQAKLAVREIGRLHGQYWNRIDQPLFAGFHRSLAPTQRLLVQIVYISSLTATLRNFEGCFSDDLRRLAESYGPRVADHISDMASGPMTLMHGDFRLDNMFFGADDATDFAVVDWQLSGIGSGLYDVAYFLV